jgi:hypothetical protein
MRELTPDEHNLWKRVTGSVNALGEPRRPGIDVPFQLLSPRPSWVLDLHGQTVWHAYHMCKTFIQDAYFENVRRITIITGRSGAIREEFPTWMEQYPVHRHELLIGGGAFRILIAKKPQKTAD